VNFVYFYREFILYTLDLSSASSSTTSGMNGSGEGEMEGKRYSPLDLDALT
jgi:hypothetical protein